MRRLVEYDWPGNVRELNNVLERASSAAGDGIILEEHLPPEVRNGEGVVPGDDTLLALKDEVAQAERRAILRALKLSGGNRSEAARMLGIHRTGLYQKMKQYSIGTRVQP